MKNKKISYILATNRPIFPTSPSIKAVLDLAAHEKEILISCPANCFTNEIADISQKHNIKLIEDTEMAGACQPINRCYKASDGDYVSIMSDDIIYPPNFLDILDFMEGDWIKRKKFKLVNIMWDGGPCLMTYGHDGYVSAENPEGKGGFMYPLPPHTKNFNEYAFPFSIIPMPFVARETVENLLDGHIYHPDFRHHFGDNWMGFFVSKTEVFEKFTWRCPFINYKVDTKNQRSNSSHDTNDLLVFQKLVERYFGPFPTYNRDYSQNREGQSFGLYSQCLPHYNKYV